MYLEFKNYEFELVFFDPEAEDVAPFIVPVSVRASSYDHAVLSALMQGQEIVRANDETANLFMRLQKTS